MKDLEREQSRYSGNKDIQKEKEKAKYDFGHSSLLKCHLVTHILKTDTLNP